MQKHNEDTLKNVIQELLKTYKLERKINELNIAKCWSKLMGKMIANHTKSIYLKDKKLFVHVDSAPLKNELHYAKEKIVTLINKEFGKELINEVILK